MRLAKHTLFYSLSVIITQNVRNCQYSPHIPFPYQQQFRTVYLLARPEPDKKIRQSSQAFSLRYLLSSTDARVSPGSKHTIKDPFSVSVFKPQQRAPGSPEEKSLSIFPKRRNISSLVPSRYPCTCFISQRNLLFRLLFP